MRAVKKKFNLVVLAKPADPTKLINAIKISNKASVSVKKDKAGKIGNQYLPPDTIKQIAEILGPIVLKSDTLAKYHIVITGNIEIFDTHANLVKWLKDYGANVYSSVQRNTTHLIKGATYGTRSNQHEKDTRLWKNKGSRVVTLSEKQYLMRAGEIAKRTEDDNADESSPENTPKSGPTLNLLSPRQAEPGRR